MIGTWPGSDTTLSPTLYISHYDVVPTRLEAYGVSDVCVCVLQGLS